MKLVFWTIKCGALLLLAGCGGEDSGERFDVQAAHANYARLSGTWSMSGVGSDGRTYVFSSTYQTLEDRPFPYTGERGSRRQSTRVGHGWSKSIDYFATGTSLPIGSEIGSTYCLEIAPAPLPTDAKVGDTGLRYNAWAYRTSCVPPAPVDIGSLTSRYGWTIDEIDNAPYFCIQEAHNDSEIIYDFRECYELSASNSLGPHAVIKLHISGTPSEPDFSVIAKGVR
jgi:hypothetical protein